MDVSLYTAYYGYLFAASWPACVGLILLVGFLFVRVRQRYLFCRSSRGNGLKWAGWGCFVALAVITSAIYGRIFLTTYAAWKEKPSTYQGEVVEKEQDAVQGYRLWVQGGELESGSVAEQTGRLFLVDGPVFEQVKVGDNVKIGYLTKREEVFLFEVLKKADVHILEE